MAKILVNDTVWLTRSAHNRGGRAQIGRPSRAVLARLAALSAAAAAIFAVTITAAPMPGADRAAAGLAAASKSDARLPLWNGPLAPVAPSGPRMGAAEPEKPLDAAVRAAQQDASLPAAPEPAGGWRETEFPQVTAVDGRTLEAGGLRIRLDGVRLAEAGEVCRTLDGRLEACATRAATQLELITRWRKVTCRYRTETPSEATGSCRIGTTDLAARLAKTGYAQRMPEGTQMVADARRPD